MKWHDDLQLDVEENVPLADRTWYRSGGPARYFCQPTSLEQVCEIVKRSREHELPLKILGEGANVLVRDEGFNGIVVHLSKESFGQVSLGCNLVTAGSAAELPDVIHRTVKAGLAGLEILAGIPGTIGGAVRMNAGGKYGEIGHNVTSVTFVDELGEVKQWDRSRLVFHYRKTNLDNTIITEVVFTVRQADPEQLEKRYRQIWDFKKATQPLTRNNSGCVFKNPIGHKAGQLIDRAGLKGLTFGGATVCEQHANFIIAEPHTKTADILALTERIQQQVRKEFDVDLELEIDVW